MTKLICDRCGGEQEVKTTQAAKLIIHPVDFRDPTGIKCTVVVTIQAESLLGDLCKGCRAAILGLALKALQG